MIAIRRHFFRTPRSTKLLLPCLGRKTLAGAVALGAGKRRGDRVSDVRAGVLPDRRVPDRLLNIYKGRTVRPERTQPAGPHHGSVRIPYPVPASDRRGDGVDGPLARREGPQTWSAGRRDLRRELGCDRVHLRPAAGS